MLRPTCRRCASLTLLALPGLAAADEVPTLAVVEVTSRSTDLVGVATTASEGSVSARQLASRPLQRPAEVLEGVPGLIVSQHSGDGKANQYYLRGFNLDHGTDFATSLMGMPVNLPTHAHGQGYADLQFLIPELVDRLHYRKGPYAAEAGDFATAGSASIDYLRRLAAPFAELGVGERGYRRALLAGSPQAAGGTLLYALEWTANDGPWSLPEKLAKLNGLLRYSQGSRDNGWSVAAMAYAAQWAATDQVPRRAVASGLISRFGNLDPTDGGRTQRYSLSAEWAEKSPTRHTRVNAYAIDYRLALWSDFTFCTLGCQPGPGDQFEQADRRQVYGLQAARTWYRVWGSTPIELTLGLQSRYDDIGQLGLYTTTARRRWGTVRQDRVKEGSLALYGEGLVQWHEKFRSVLGLREDVYRFEVASDTAANSGRVEAAIASPRLSLIAGPWGGTEYYANYGYGFHSNDARGITAKVNPDFRDPAFGTAVSGATPLVRARAMELGVRSAILPTLQTSLALWRLALASELVFVGDAGSTQPSFPSQRRGIEWATTWTPSDALTVDADFARSWARYTAIDDSVAGRFISGAIEKTASLGMAWDAHAQWSGSLRLRYFGPRPLSEDDRVRSPSSTLFNLRIGYRVARQIRLTLDVLNLFDRKLSDIDYYYASQLRGEPAPVSDVHFHPAEPRTLRLSLRVPL